MQAEKLTLLKTYFELMAKERVCVWTVCYRHAHGNVGLCRELAQEVFIRLWTSYRTLRPGATTYEDDWQYIDFMPPESFIVSEYRIKILSYQIDQDWIKTIRKDRDNRNQIKLPVHL